MKKLLNGTLALILSLGVARAHCQIPCGIYDDDVRIALLKEHAATIEKSMKQIVALSGSIKIADANQLVRWVTNKEEHAEKIQELVKQYFLAQRIPLPAAGADRQPYYRKLELLHQIIVYSMKCKQTTDVANLAKLQEAIHEFAHVYSGK